MSSLEKSLHVSEADLLAALSADIVQLLEAMRVPAYIVDRQRRLRWQNAASIELVGDLRGRLDSSVSLDRRISRARGRRSRGSSTARRTRSSR